MSTLYWKPAPKDEPPDRELPAPLRNVLAKRLWNHEGAVHAVETEVGDWSVSYLEGLADGRVDGAQELLDAIRAHGAVLIWIAD